MSRRIPQSFIHDLIARADLLDVIGARVALKRSGGGYKGLCPFHDEKTPSFSVSPEKGFYHCFGCGAHGNAVDFVMRYENRSFPEAIEALAEALHLEVPVENQDAAPEEFAELHEVLREADQIYRRALREHPAAVEYLKKRGVDGPTAARFGIGYAPDAWDTLVRALGGTPRRLEALVTAGLAKASEQGRRYDAFRDRIMFPIRDSRGRVVGFGGRVHAAGEPKYLNSPETPVFHKRQALYGLHEARQRPGRPEQIVVVEGYLDVVALVQHGIEPALATLGTATTAEHVRQLTRLAPRIVFCFDGDAAGRRAAWRAAEAALPFGGGAVEIEFLLLPEGDDPDTLVRRLGPDDFRARLAAALPLSTFLLQELSAEAKPDSSDGRARLVTLMKPLLARLPQGVYRELVVGELAALVGMSPDRLEAAVDAAPRETQPAARGAPEGAPPARETPGAAPVARGRGAASRSPIRKIIALLLHYPSAARGLSPTAELAALDLPGADLLRRLLEMAGADPTLTPAQIVEAFRDDEEGRYLRHLIAEAPLDDAASAPAVLADSLAQLVARQRQAAEAAAVRRRGAGGGPGAPADPVAR